MIAAGAQALAVIGWLCVLKLIQMALWPWLGEGFGKLAYGAAYPLSLLLFALLSWYCGIIHLPVQAALLPFLALLGIGLHRRRYSLAAIRREVHWDVLFLLCFAFMLEVRFFNPSISYAEKFMDHAILASVMRNPVVAPLDPWYAGGDLSVYYYLGHWMMGAVGLTAGAPSPVTFNLILPTVFANAAAALYAAGHVLLPRLRVLPVLTLLLVNPSFLVLAASGAGAHSVMWDSTRTIADTINEFPLFSFLWGDPHAHVIALFTQALFIFIIVYAYREWNDLSGRGRWVVVGAAALALGSMPGINSWDVLVYAPVVLVTGLLIWRRAAREGDGDDPCPWRFLVCVPPLAVLTYLPYYLMLDTQGISGLGLVPSPSAVSEFLLVYGVFMAIFWVAAVSDLKTRPWLLLAAAPFLLAGYFAAAIAAVPLAAFAARKDVRAADLLAAFGLAVIIFTELFYLVDGMGDVYYRMNTVFKFGLVAWMMMGTAAMAYIGGWLSPLLREQRVPERAAKAAPLIIVVLLLAAPVAMPDLTYGYGGKTLDGLAWVGLRHPGDAQALPYVSSLPVGAVILEAEGGDYSYYSRISSFTGVPTVIGMPFHEQMWRGDAAMIGIRMADVRAMYEDPGRAPALYEAYGVDYVYAGTAEHERYAVSLPEDALVPVWSGDGVVMYRVL